MLIHVSSYCCNILIWNSFFLDAIPPPTPTLPPFPDVTDSAYHSINVNLETRLASAIIMNFEIKKNIIDDFLKM